MIIFKNKFHFFILSVFIVSTSFISNKTSFHTRNDSNADTIFFIIIDKSDYELKVFDKDGWYATYPVVFGNKNQGDKMQEGDRKTPNGHFTIIQKKKHPKWGDELLLDYPTKEDILKFKQRQSSGLISPSAKIGSGIAIHGTRPQEEWTVDNSYNWTDGCISLKYSEMKDLFSYIPLGTKVTIQP